MMTGIAPLMQIFLNSTFDGKSLKEDRTGGRKGKRDRTQRDLRKGNGGDTGRNDEHKEVIVTKRNQFFIKNNIFFLSHTGFVL